MSVFFPKSYLVDICIPAYKEMGYIGKTIDELAKQTWFSRSQVLVGAYDDETADEAKARGFPNVKIVSVNLKGVGNARRITTLGGRSPYILTLDADCRFSTDDAIEKLLDPIMKGECRVTYCPVTLDGGDGEQVPPAGILFHQVINNNRYLVPFGFEPGLTMARETYQTAGGWRDLVMWEGSALCADIMLSYGFVDVFRMVDATQIITSSRRFAVKDPLKAFDFNNAFR